MPTFKKMVAAATSAPPSPEKQVKDELRRREEDSQNLGRVQAEASVPNYSAAEPEIKNVAEEHEVEEARAVRLKEASAVAERMLASAEKEEQRRAEIAEQRKEAMEDEKLRQRALQLQQERCSARQAIEQARRQRSAAKARSHEENHRASMETQRAKAAVAWQQRSREEERQQEEARARKGITHAAREEQNASQSVQVAPFRQNASANGAFKYAEVADLYDGQWVAPSGEPVAWIKDGQMVGALGTVVPLIFHASDSCSFEMGGVTYTGELQKDRRTLTWSHGEVWKRMSPREATSRSKQPVKSPEQQKAEEQAKLKEFEAAKASSDAGIERARKAFEQEKARKAAARQRVEIEKKQKESRQQIEVGSFVRLQNLQGRLDLNGTVGKVMSYNAVKERWLIKLDDETTKFFKAENLAPCTGQL